MSCKIKLLSYESTEIFKKIDNNDLKLCVVGIGRIGLPTALSVAASGIKTIGVDINENLVTMINSNTFPLPDEPGYDEIFSHVLEKKLFSATTDFASTVEECDVILLSLPTPMDENNIPDYSALISVGKELNKFLTKDSLIVVESTVEPGFIENELIPIIENNSRSLKCGLDFFIGVCPETANPGEIQKDFSTLPRLVGSTEKRSTEIIMYLYSHIFPVDLIEMPNCKTANAVKLTTNVFRDLNVAFVNELSILFSKLGIDTFEVLNAAKRKYNFQIHFPGGGVGGPCLPVNSYQILNSAKKFDQKLLELIDVGRKINEKMPKIVVNLVEDAFFQAKSNLKNSTILILGISYKPNVKDIQLTPAEKVINILKEKSVNVKIYDPYFKNIKAFEILCQENIDIALENSDAILILTAHNEFLKYDFSSLTTKLNLPILIDTRGIVKKEQLKNPEIIFKGIGRTDI